MIGGQQGFSASQDGRLLQFQVFIIINVVQGQQGQHAGIGAGPRQPGPHRHPEIMGLEQPGGQPGQPFVEVAQNDAGARTLFPVQDPGPEKPAPRQPQETA